MKPGRASFIVIIVILSAFVVIKGHDSETFDEELLLKPLTNGDVLAEFNFVTLGSNPVNHFDLMPKVVGEFLVDHQLQELQFSLSRGVWRWETPIHPVPNGAMVAARFNPDVREVDHHWRRLTNALSGQFCASLNFLDSTRTTEPEWSFSPIGATAENGTTHFRYGALPGENVCTENLTPWKKLLPCGSKRGLASLLNARSIHKSHYHSLGLDLRKVCRNGRSTCNNPVIELRLHVSLVFDPTTFPENEEKHRKLVKLNSNNWSVRSLFGIGFNSRCPMADKTSVFVAINNELKELVKLEPQSEKSVEYKAKKVFIYDVEDFMAKGTHNIHANYKEEFVLNRIKTAVQPLHVSRYQTGYGQEKGGLVTELKNSGTEPLTVVYYNVIPWFLRVYFHTLTIKSKMSHNRMRNLEPLRSKFIPGLDRVKPYTLELVVTLPPKSLTRISLDFEHSILKWNEYPPDANKGFYIGSALVSAVVNASQTHCVNLSPKHSTFMSQLNNYDANGKVLIQLYSESLLINLPTPDFSMPYNVICLACTVVALAFGPLLNLTTKSLKIDSENTEQPPSKVVQILQKIPILNKFFTTRSSQENSKEDEEESKKDR